MRIRRVNNQRELETLVDEFITMGYRVVEEGETSTKLKKKEYGGGLAHLIIFLVIGWWTFFLANIAYAIFKYYTGEEVLVKVEGPAAVAV